MKNLHSILRRSASAFLVLGLIAAPFEKQSAMAASGLNSQLFYPIEDNGKFLGTNDTGVLPSMTGSAGLFLNLVGDPLIQIDRSTGKRRSIVHRLVTADAMFAWGIFDIFEAAVAVPVHLYSQGQQVNSSKSVSGTYLGDARLKLKLQVISRDTLPVGFAVVPILSVPTGNTGNFLGNPGATGGGMVIADAAIPGLWERDIILGANLGMLGRKSVATENIDLSSEFNYSLAANVPLPSKFEALLDLQGRTIASQAFQKEAGNPLELTGGARMLHFQEEWGVTLTAGAGTGLTQGVGSPVFRIFSGIAYAVPPPIRDGDADSDNIRDSVDQCDEEPEDVDGHADQDGCPDAPVTVRTKTIDALTGKPVVTAKAGMSPGAWRTEASPGYATFITDVPAAHKLAVEAPNYAPASLTMSTYAGYTTSLTIALMPLEARMTGRVTDAESGAALAGWINLAGTGVRVSLVDGAFELTHAADGQSYQLEATATGYTTQQRGVVFAAGGVAEENFALKPVPVEIVLMGSTVDAQTGAGLAATLTIGANGEQLATDAAGNFRYVVPAPGELQVRFVANGYAELVTSYAATGLIAPQIVRLTKKKILVVENKLVLDPIFFQTGKAVILENSYPILDSVAEYMAQNPDVKLRLEGHTDSKGNAAKNKVLSQKRVESVIEFLKSRGVAEYRLSGKGFGSSVPIADNKTDEGMAKNRRVEFVVIGTKTE